MRDCIRVLHCFTLTSHLGDELLFLFGASGWVGCIALLFELVLDKRLERGKVSATAVAITLGVSFWGKVLDGWVADE